MGDTHAADSVDPGAKGSETEKDPNKSLARIERQDQMTGPFGQDEQSILLRDIMNLETRIELLRRDYEMMTEALEDENQDITTEEPEAEKPASPWHKRATLKVARVLTGRPERKPTKFEPTHLTRKEKKQIATAAMDVQQQIEKLMAERDEKMAKLDTETRDEHEAKSNVVNIRDFVAKRSGRVLALAEQGAKAKVDPVQELELRGMTYDGRPIYEQKTASEYELSVEQTELLKNLEKQYSTMHDTLKIYHISTVGIPAWEQVKKGLTPEVLDKALKLQEPALLLVPPTTRKSKVEAINKHPAKGQKSDTYTYELNNNDLWNGGKSQSENKWRVSIVEGIQDVQQDKEINDGKRTNYEMSKLWVKKYENQGLDVMNDADAYLTLMMKGLAEGKPIDPQTWCVLNGKNLTKSTLVALGAWSDGQVYLSDGYPDRSYSYLHLRGSVEVNVHNP